MKIALLTLLVSATSALALEPATQDESAFIVRPWDTWSLLDRRPANRMLWRQHTGIRVFEPTSRAVVLSDVLTGTQLPRAGAALGTWHGHAIADSYLGVRATENLDINFNLIAFNMSASLGYRSTTAVVPGIAAHLHGKVDGMEADLIALDLSTVTLGQGLLFEQLPLEGGMGRLKWGDWWVRLLIGGQLHEENDDLFSLTAGWGDWQLNWYAWANTGLSRWPQWLGLTGEVPGLPDTMRIGVEGLVRLGGVATGRTAALARIDWMPALRRGALHLGYQYRWYDHGYGPYGTGLTRTRHRPAFIWREDTYVTNAYEAYWPSGLFEQQWHTVMLEADIPLGRPWIVGRIEGELWARLFNDASGPEDHLAVLNTDGSAAHWWPDPDVRFYHRIGVEIRPFEGRRDRLRLWVVNKVAAARLEPMEPTRNRFVSRRPLVALELEVFL